MKRDPAYKLQDNTVTKERECNGRLPLDVQFFLPSTSNVSNECRLKWPLSAAVIMDHDDLMPTKM